MHQSSKIIIVLCLLILGGCAAVDKNARLSQIENIILAEPVPAQMRSQSYVLRYTRILEEAPLKEQERADFLYQRGIQYDKLGMSLLAQYDFHEAIKIKPNMASAYNSIGIYYTQQGKYLQAYEAFDSTLDINPEYDFAFLNRGIALYYGGRAELAVKDFGQFLTKDQTDPIRAIWLYIAESQIDPEQAKVALAQARKQMDQSNWTVKLVDFYLGDLSEAALLNALPQGLKTQLGLAERTCEVYFYLGKYHRTLGNTGAAKSYFKFALSTNVFDYVEHRYARLELNLLRDQNLAKRRIN